MSPPKGFPRNNAESSPGISPRNSSSFASPWDLPHLARESCPIRKRDNCPPGLFSTLSAIAWPAHGKHPTSHSSAGLRAAHGQLPIWDATTPLPPRTPTLIHAYPANSPPLPVRLLH